MIMRVREGRTVAIDGTEASSPDSVTREEVQQAQESAFQARLESFAQIGRNLSRRISRRSGTAGSLSFNGDSATMLNDAGRANSAPLRPSEGLEEKREQLLEARRVALERKARERGSRKPPGYLEITVEREHIIEQSLRSLCSVPCIDLLAKNLSIRFKGEDGIDAGGVRRDWFDCIGRNLVAAAENGEGHLMVLSDNTLFPRPYEERLTDILAIGRLAGLAVWFGISLPLPLGSVVCKFLLDESISPQDLRRLDPDFYQFRVQPVLAPEGVAKLEEALCEPLMFVSAPTELRESKELCPGGAALRVTEENKEEYIKLLCEHNLCGDIQEQIRVFLQGFWDICPKDELICSGVTYRELALLISGYSTLDPVEWHSHTESSSSSSSHEVIEWFWELVNGMSNEERAKLLHFVTGSSRLPSRGFAGVSPKFNISVQGNEVEHLPHAHTCGNQLVLPRYTSKEMLAGKMRMALANDEGFGIM